MTTPEIREVTKAAAPEAEAIARLLRQLTDKPVAFGEEELAAITQAPASHLFVASLENIIVGMVSVGVYRTPTGRKAWIEDLVVDTAHRGQGIGGALIDSVQERMAAEGPVTLTLTSRPTRVAANAMYRNRMFDLKETNVYKKNL